MATYTLVPNEDHSPDAGTWSIQSGQGSDIWAVLDGVGNYIYHGTTAQDFRVGFTTQALGATETIDSVQCCITAHTSNTRSDTAVVKIDVENVDNHYYFTDNHTVTDNSGAPATYCSAAETENPATTVAWIESDIDTLRMDVEITSFSGGSPDVTVYYAYLTIVTSIPIPTYTSDDNVILKNGLTELKNGLTIIK